MHHTDLAHPSQQKIVRCNDVCFGIRVVFDKVECGCADTVELIGSKGFQSSPNLLLRECAERELGNYTEVIEAALVCRHCDKLIRALLSDTHF